MKNFLFLFLLVLSQFCRAADGGELIYWMVMSTDSIVGTTQDETQSFTATELGVNGARICYKCEDGTSGYLPIIGVYQNGGNYTFDGVSGVPVPGGYHAELGSYVGSAYTFVLELGNWNNGAWTGTSMVSDAVSYDYLKENQHIAQWEGQNPSYARPWVPQGFTVVPEPSSGVLLLLGGALLALRRRLKGAV